MNQNFSPLDLNNDMLMDIMDGTLRPRSLNQFYGQSALKERLNIYIKSALGRGDPLDHMLFLGPPGLGKTTLAIIIARAMGRECRNIVAPALKKTGDLAACLTQLQPQDVLFIDEIHRLPIALEEVLYGAMEDYQLNVMMGEAPHGRMIKIPLPPFTLIGATTRLGLLSAPLRDRFLIQEQLQVYDPQDLVPLILQGAKVLCINLSLEGAQILSLRARGTPRIALRLLRRVRDFVVFDLNEDSRQKQFIESHHVEDALKKLGIDSEGLHDLDREYIMYLASLGGGPVGIETLCAGLNQDLDTLKDSVEPFLIHKGWVLRTRRGRCLSEDALKYSLFHQGLKKV